MRLKYRKKLALYAHGSKSRRVRNYFIIFVILLGFNACSIKKMAMNQVANALTEPGGSIVFTGDNDPELVGAALPFAIKMYESLLVSNPGHQGLQLQTGSLYIMYANAFLQTPANMLAEEEYQKQEFLLERAKNLYLRGRDILLNALERKYPGSKSSLPGCMPVASFPTRTTSSPGDCMGWV